MPALPIVPAAPSGSTACALGAARLDGTVIPPSAALLDEGAAGDVVLAAALPAGVVPGTAEPAVVDEQPATRAATSSRAATAGANASPRRLVRNMVGTLQGGCDS